MKMRISATVHHTVEIEQTIVDDTDDVIYGVTLWTPMDDVERFTTEPTLERAKRTAANWLSEQAMLEIEAEWLQAERKERM